MRRRRRVIKLYRELANRRLLKLLRLVKGPPKTGRVTEDKPEVDASGVSN